MARLHSCGNQSRIARHCAGFLEAAEATPKPLSGAVPHVVEALERTIQDDGSAPTLPRFAHVGTARAAMCGPDRLEAQRSTRDREPISRRRDGGLAQNHETRSSLLHLIRHHVPVKLFPGRENREQLWIEKLLSWP